MAEEQDKGQKTEKPTPRKIQEARKEGNYAKSTDVNSAAVLIFGILSLAFFGSGLLSAIAGLFNSTYMNLHLTNVSADNYSSQVTSGFINFFFMLFPILLVVMLGGLIANFGQAGFLISSKALQPKLSKISPLKGLKRIFSMRSIVELIKGILKILIVGGIAYTVILSTVNSLDNLILLLPQSIVSFFGEVMLKITLRIVVFLSFVAIADYAWQRYDHQKKLMMTKQEIKDEQKRYEGNPEIKSRIKSVQQRLSRNRMIQEVPDATVVVTNPTHIAVALKYEQGSKDSAPKIVAMGQRKIAERIREVAREAGVPIIQNKPLARNLFKSLKVGMEIPAIFYQAVAEILAKVFTMKKKR